MPPGIALKLMAAMALASAAPPAVTEPAQSPSAPAVAGAAPTARGEALPVESVGETGVTQGITQGVSPEAGAGDGTVLATQRRLVTLFDFEEAETAPRELPLAFVRYVASDQGFPPFGTVRLSDVMALRGRWSLGLQTAGGSLAVRLSPTAIPVLPMGDYAIACSVRTRGLVHARARLAAWLLDVHGQVIAESRAESPLVHSPDAWRHLMLEVPGRFEHAAALQLEVQVLQPRQFAARSHAMQPLLDDVSGGAWFDDLAVWHLPRISLGTGQAGNVVLADAPPQLHLLVRDLAREDLIAELDVYDVDGACVWTDRFPAPRGRTPLALEPALTAFGWYRAHLRITHGESLVARRTLDFIWAPASRGGPRRAAGFGLSLPPLAADQLKLVPMLVERLGAAEAVLPVWPDGDLAPDPTDIEARRQLIETFLSDNVDLTFALDRMPVDLAAQAGLDSSNVLELLSRPAAEWRSAMGDWLLGYGLEVSGWQISAGEPDAMTDPAAKQDAAAAAARGLGEFVPTPGIILPWPAERSAASAAARPRLNLRVPYQFPRQAVGELAASASAAGDVLTLEPLPAAEFGERAQAADLMVRALHAWRSGAQRMMIDAPWSWSRDRPPQPMPAPAFAAWRALAEWLADRRWVGALALDPHSTCWIIEGPSADDAALILWTERHAADPAAARLVLGDGPVELVDAFGNVSPVERDAQGLHILPLREMPALVRNISLELAQFRAGFAIEPAFIPATHEVHELEAVLTNAWDVAVSGSIRLAAEEALRLAPRVQEFTIPPRQTLRIPIRLVVERSTLAGPKEIEAEVRLVAETDHHMRLSTHIEVGLEEIGLSSNWMIDRNDRTGEDDLVVTQYITNRGERPLNLTAYLMAPGVSQKRRAISGLAPGVTAVRTYRLAGAAPALAGRSIRLGVSERDSAARLNDLIEIPALAIPARAGATEAP
jgi:hypothetical protein